MPSFDINAILSAALATVVAEAVAPLVERIATLEKNEEYLTNRIAALEDQAIVTSNAIDKRIAALEGAPSVLASQYTPISNEQFKAMLEEWDIGRLVQRVEALEAHTTVLDQHGGLLEYLDNQEWFWEKLTRKAKEVADAAVEQSMDHHLECYDHDNYDEIASKVDDMPDADELLTKDDLSESVRDAVQDLSFEISVR